MGNNFIFGSGIVGYLAKEMLGWAIIPFKKSRFYSFETSYADDYLVFDKGIDEFIGTICPSMAQIIMRSVFSYKGGLIKEDPILRGLYLEKVYGDSVPTLASKLLKTSFSTYNIGVKDLYKILGRKFIDEINQNIKTYGEVLSVDLKEKVIKFRNKSVEFDNIISTIPLDVMCRFTGNDYGFKAKDLYVYHLATPSVDLEGAVQCFICDKDIDFYKVQKIGKNEYLFWSNIIIEQPYKYFGMCLGYNLDLLEVVKIENAIPVGDPPNLDFLSESGIFCVGSTAQWDDFIDVSSSIKRLLRYKSE